MSICNECWGKGYTQKRGVQFDCSKCKGTGVIIENEPMTNEEWFDTLTTEEKAKVISRLNWYHGNVYEIEQWLKDIHKNEEK